jgi:ABC-2 type transport system ATP-binding protein
MHKGGVVFDQTMAELQQQEVSLEKIFTQFTQ